MKKHFILAWYILIFKIWHKFLILGRSQIFNFPGTKCHFRSAPVHTAQTKRQICPSFIDDKSSRYDQSCARGLAPRVLILKRHQKVRRNDLIIPNSIQEYLKIYTLLRALNHNGTALDTRNIQMSFIFYFFIIRLTGCPTKNCRLKKITRITK